MFYSSAFCLYCLYFFLVYPSLCPFFVDDVGSMRFHLPLTVATWQDVAGGVAPAPQLVEAHPPPAPVASASPGPLKTTPSMQDAGRRTQCSNETSWRLLQELVSSLNPHPAGIAQNIIQRYTVNRSSAARQFQNSEYPGYGPAMPFHHSVFS